MVINMEIITKLYSLIKMKNVCIFNEGRKRLFSNFVVFIALFKNSAQLYPTKNKHWLLKSMFNSFSTLHITHFEIQQPQQKAQLRYLTMILPKNIYSVFLYISKIYSSSGIVAYWASEVIYGFCVTVCIKYWITFKLSLKGLKAEMKHPMFFSQTQKRSTDNVVLCRH